MMTATRRSLVQGLTAVVVVAFLVVLGYYLVQPGYTWTRAALFAVLGGLAVTGAGGVIYQRGRLASVGAGGLLLLGFWQAVLWIYILSVVVVLAVAFFTTPERDYPNRSA
ncbi:hypothetical protein [Haloarchaeobius salinus]|uniref:hypothetical protein n=1 Tax=Haloarchaeobius salinus TaxID=1198298 RepID=UPI00210909EC|nr:hypothetical protein [Haloarchaeobius salinus]